MSDLSDAMDACKHALRVTVAAYEHAFMETLDADDAVVMLAGALQDTPMVTPEDAYATLAMAARVIFHSRARLAESTHN